MITWKDLTWWREQQGMGNRGVKHKHRFNSNLDVERALSKTGGERWMHSAQDREHWRHLTQTLLNNTTSLGQQDDNQNSRTSHPQLHLQGGG